MSTPEYQRSSVSGDLVILQVFMERREILFPNVLNSSKDALNHILSTLGSSLFFARI